MTTSMRNVRFVPARHSQLLRQVELETGRSTLGVWWRPSLRFGGRQLLPVIRPVAAL